MGPIVRVLQGDLKGTEGIDFDGNIFYKFLGIPFAKPPIGNLRFKDPLPVESWIGIRDATKEGDACYQKDRITKEPIGSEDCLNLNVFTRKLPESDIFNLKPVMVWIHGGAFIAGSNTPRNLGPEYLMTEDVVLVTINYRVGILGFLRIKDESSNISGNMAFKDQVEALRWIKSNIRQFNGDPDNVTVFGGSAGSASTSLLVLSPLAKGLFHEAICQSGAALCQWVDEADYSAVHLARQYDPNISTEKEAAELFMSLPIEELNNLQEKILHGRLSIRIGFMGLVLEPEDRKNAFMTKRPIDIIMSGDYNKVPIILGYNNKEGILFYAERKSNGQNMDKNLSLEICLPHNLSLQRNNPATSSLLEKLSDVYFSGPDVRENNISLLSDAMFTIGILGTAKNHALTSPFPVYLYKMSLDTKLNKTKIALKLESIPGCSHGDDSGYLFKNQAALEIDPGSVEELSMRRVVKLWTNFAKYGNPTPNEKEFGVKWKPVMARQLNVLNIDKEFQMEINPEQVKLDVWREVYRQSPNLNKYL
ncbi:juvenile hormone esterase-like [Anthonomus grandis grandis]|uniref:juvenile hormone esterase-like n=1 Tax=Anthonomus grandis grandis TaxID=2921223 RepID=UPI002164FB52|nr:juvenile hormone esterase-like [Anthonomus grandis grandis]